MNAGIAVMAFISATVALQLLGYNLTRRRPRIWGWRTETIVDVLSMLGAIAFIALMLT